MIPKSGYRFSEADHAPTITQSTMAIRRKAIALQDALAANVALQWAPFTRCASRRRRAAPAGQPDEQPTQALHDRPAHDHEDEENQADVRPQAGRRYRC